MSEFAKKAFIAALVLAVYTGCAGAQTAPFKDLGDIGAIVKGMRTGGNGGQEGFQSGPFPFPQQPGHPGHDNHGGDHDGPHDGHNGHGNPYALQTYFDGRSLYVFNPYINKQSSKNVSIYENGYRVLSCAGAAGFVSGDRFTVYDAKKDSWQEKTMSGFASLPFDTAEEGSILMVVREDKLTLYDTVKGSFVDVLLSGSTSLANTLLAGPGYAGVLRSDKLYIYDLRTGQGANHILSGSPDLPNFAQTSDDLIAIVRGGNDTLTIYNVAEGKLLTHMMRGSPSLRLVNFILRGNQVFVDREGTVTTYDPYSGFVDR